MCRAAAQAALCGAVELMSELITVGHNPKTAANASLVVWCMVQAALLMDIHVYGLAIVVKVCGAAFLHICSHASHDTEGHLIMLSTSDAQCYLARRSAWLTTQGSIPSSTLAASSTWGQLKLLQQRLR